jgi:hypothetical protein
MGADNPSPLNAEGHSHVGLMLRDPVYYRDKVPALNFAVENDQRVNQVFHEGSKILDLCCGSPWHNLLTFSKIFKQRGINNYSLTGVELADNYNYARFADKDTKFIIKDVFDYLTQDTSGMEQTQDMVVFTSASELLTEDENGKFSQIVADRQKCFFDAVKRILKPDGVLWFNRDLNFSKLEPIFTRYGFVDDTEKGFFHMDKSVSK